MHEGAMVSCYGTCRQHTHTHTGVRWRARPATHGSRYSRRSYHTHHGTQRRIGFMAAMCVTQRQTNGNNSRRQVYLQQYRVQSSILSRASREYTNTPAQAHREVWRRALSTTYSPYSSIPYRQSSCIIMLCEETASSRGVARKAEGLRLEGL